MDSGLIHESRQLSMDVAWYWCPLFIIFPMLQGHANCFIGSLVLPNSSFLLHFLAMIDYTSVTGPGFRESSACDVTQVNPLNAQVQILWELLLEATKKETWERTSVKEVPQYIKWLTEDLSERGLDHAQAKKCSWVKVRFYYDVHVRKLMIYSSKTYLIVWKVVADVELYKKIVKVHNLLEYSGQNLVAKAVYKDYHKITYNEMLFLKKFCENYVLRKVSKLKRKLFSI